MTKHSPHTFATDLGAKLATRSRHVCLFLGAGVAKACNLPDVVELEARVQTELSDGERDAFVRLLEGRNLESVLSHLRRYDGFVPDGKTIDDLTTDQAKDLDKSVCQSIIRALCLDTAEYSPVENLAAWLGRADYHHPVEIFTVNYDLLIETALEKQRVPYFDGFVGSLKARFRTDLVEASPTDAQGVPAQFVRLWKLHGSVNWERTGGEIVRLGQPSQNAAAIYPSDEKYLESRRVPFLVLQDRFRRALNHPETLVLISGFRFGDDHLNEMIFDAAEGRKRSEFVVFSFDDIADHLADRAARTPNLQVIGKREAIIGTERGEWVAPEHETDLWDADTMVLPDFAHFASYLAKCTTDDVETTVDA